MEDHQETREGERDQPVESKFDPKSFEIIVKSISFEADEKDCEDFFASYGEIESLKLERRFHDGRSKGSAFVKFKTDEGRQAAIADTGVQWMGRNLRIEATRSREERIKDFGDRPPRRRGRGGYGRPSRRHQDDYEGYERRDCGGYNRDRGRRDDYDDRGYDDGYDRRPRQRDDRGYGRRDEGYNNRDRGYGRDNNRDRGYGRDNGYDRRDNVYDRLRLSRGGGGSGRGRAPRRERKERVKVNESNVLFVGNLDYKSSHEDISALFSECGEVVEVRIAAYRDGRVRILC